MHDGTGPSGKGVLLATCLSVLLSIYLAIDLMGATSSLHLPVRLKGRLKEPRFQLCMMGQGPLAKVFF